MRVSLRAWKQHPARWDVAAAALFTVVSLVVYAIASDHRPGSDGHYSWLYARSLAYDHDLDFTNDYARCGDPFGIGIPTPAHRPANFFYIGPAVFWTPVVWVLKHLIASRSEACSGTIPALTLAMSSLAGGAVVLATSAVVRRFVEARIAAFSTLLVTLGGHLLYFSAMNASYSHVYDAMCVAAFLFYVTRVREDPGRRRLWIVAGVCLGLAILQRSIDVVFFAVAAAALADRAVRAAIVIGAVAFVTGVVPLLAANRAIYGVWAVYTHGPHFIHYAHAHPILLVFDQRGGVFAWAPLLWLTVPGALMLAWRCDARWLYVPLVLCGAFELYVSSAALDWEGGRRLTNLTPLGALSLAVLVTPIARWLRRDRDRLAYALGAAAVAAVTWANASVCVGYRAQRIPWDRPVGLGGRFGEGQAAALDTAEKSIGPLTALPAAWIFAARYGLPPVAFGWAVHPQWYQRSHQTLEYTADDFSFTTDEGRLLSRGLRVDPEHADRGACFVGRHASVVLSLQWPVVTRTRISYAAKRATALTVDSRSFFGHRSAWERVKLQAGENHEAYFDVPPGALDSGVNEIELDTADDGVCLFAMEWADDTRYPSSAESQASFPVMIWHARSPHGSRAEVLARLGLVASSHRFRDTVVDVQQHASKLTMRTGKIDSRGAVTWTASYDYDDGRHPEIAIDPATGHGVEMHDGDGGVWTHEVDVLP
ncbi:MAG TPA: hypothetical protein VGH28_02600 [Polyangiaceae bacterium]|jgi:hypothetical protein